MSGANHKLQTTSEESEQHVTDQQRIIADRYVVGDLIGQGGMSSVYRGTDTKLGRQVAIKILKADLSSDDVSRDRFKQEAQASSRMAHPTIVRVFDAGDELLDSPSGPQNLPYIVMEYVEGQDLRRLISKGAIGQREACLIVEDVLTALEYSHKAGVIHRDIKPGNIMITKTGQVKVMDFGIARAVSETSASVEHTTAILGTASYFSPEQAKGDVVDARTDLYSAGVVLYELLAGSVPFRGDSAVSVAYQHVSEKPVPPSERNAAVTPALDRVVLKALAKDKNKRYESASEFREYLKKAASGEMPDFEVDQGGFEELFGTDTLSSSQQAVRQLSSGGGSVRTQIRPPVMWVWAGILSLAVIIVAVMFWLANLSAMEITPANTRVVPDLVELSEKDARKLLADLKLNMITITEYSDKVEVGKVIKSDPEEGARVVARSNVRVFISRGRENSAVPELALLSIADATAEIEKLGLKVGNVDKRDDPTIGADIVITSDPIAGTALKPGDTVNLIVSSGLVNVPDVLGQTITVARDVMSQSQISVLLKPEPGCAQEASSTVHSQSIVGQQKQGSTVTLTYCSG